MPIEQRPTQPTACAIVPIAAARLLKHARYYWSLLAEEHLTRRLFGGMLRRIAMLPSPTGR